MRSWHGNLSPFGLWHTVSSAALSVYAVNGFDPALVFDFVNEYYRTGGVVSTFDAAMTHARSGNATMVDSDGLLKWGPHNLLRYSEQFDNAAWGKLNATVSSGVADPFGGTSAFTLTASAANGQILQSYGSAGVGTTYSNTIYIRRRSGTGTVSLFNPNGGGISAKSITTEWAAYSVVGAGAAVTNFSGVRLATSGDEVDVAFGHGYRSDLGGMVDNPDTGNSYVPTTSAARYLPRRGNHVYNGTSWVNAGVLIESEARTNLVTYSNDFTDASWAKANVTVAADALVANPESTSGAVLVSTTGSGTGTLYKDIPYSEVRTNSFWLKAGDVTLVQFRPETTTQTPNNPVFDLANGTVNAYTASGVLDATITPSQNGWYRCSVTLDGSVIGTERIGWTPMDDASTVTTAAKDCFYIYGAQLEAGSTPSSYIPTNSGSTVTRAADTLTAPSANLPWPTPNVIGPELIASDLSTIFVDVSEITATETDLVFNTTTQNQITASIAGGVVGKMYQVDFEVYDVVTGGVHLRFGAGGTNDAVNMTAGVYSYSLYWDTNANIAFRASASTTELKVKNISVREIDPLAVSIQMDGRMTYVQGATYKPTFALWGSGGDYIIVRNRTTVSPLRTGAGAFQQAAASVVDSVEEGIPGSYSPGINVPFNIASRHGSTFINGAVDGTALTANTTPTALPDLSSTNLSLAYDFMGNIGKLRMWADDLADAGIAEASA